MTEIDRTPRYAVYARKSTEDAEKQIISIRSQVQQLQLDFRHLKIIDIVEEEKSAFKPYNRPRFAELLQKIEENQIDGILAWHPDRLARNEIDGSALTYMLRSGKLKDLKFATYTFEDSPEGIMWLQMAFSQSQYSSAKLSRDVKRGLNDKALIMGYPPGVAPEGYLNNTYKLKGEKDWRVDAERFDNVQQMWLMLLAGRSVSSICRHANEQWAFRTVNHRKRGGGPISLNAVYRLFHNIKYAGYFYWRGELRKGAWQPMITLQQYDLAQEILSDRGHSRPKNLYFPYGIGLIRCGECGAWITAERKKKHIKSIGQPRTYDYYHCTHRKAKTCAQPSIGLHTIEEAIEKLLRSIQIDPKVAEFAEGVTDRHEQRVNGLRQASVEDIKRRIAELTGDLDRLNRAYYKGDLGRDFFEQERALLTKELARKHSDIDQIEVSDVTEHPKLLRIFDFAVTALSTFQTASPEERRQMALEVGSNYILKDGKLRIEPREWFNPIIRFNQTAQSHFQTLEPTRASPTTGSRQHVGAINGANLADLSRLVKEVRTAVTNATSAGK